MATNRDIFDTISSTWYGVRHWPLLPHEMDELRQRWQHGTFINLGCGVGADFLPFRDGRTLVGLDFSRGMLNQARRHREKHGVHADLVQGELMRLPFADGSFDHAIGIACYHHIDGERNRTLALSELLRVLRPGGEAFVSVWNHAQPRFVRMTQDQLVPWRYGNTTLQRYYHLFTLEEFETALMVTGFDIIRIGHGAMQRNPDEADTRNLCALIRRPTTTQVGTTCAESEERG